MLLIAYYENLNNTSRIDLIVLSTDANMQTITMMMIIRIIIVIIIIIIIQIK